MIIPLEFEVKNEYFGYQINQLKQFLKNKRIKIHFFNLKEKILQYIGQNIAILEIIAFILTMIIGLVLNIHVLILRILIRNQQYMDKRKNLRTKKNNLKNQNENSLIKVTKKNLFKQQYKENFSLQSQLLNKQFCQDQRDISSFESRVFRVPQAISNHGELYLINLSNSKTLLQNQGKIQQYTKTLTFSNTNKGTGCQVSEGGKVVQCGGTCYFVFVNKQFQRLGNTVCILNAQWNKILCWNWIQRQ